MLYRINAKLKVLSVAGYHHSGKTTTAVALITELRKRGYKVASIKDIHYEKFTMEKIGSNSWKHLSASNETVFARGINETYQIWSKKLSLNDMLANIDADYVIVEGMKKEALPRIICGIDAEQLEELNNGTVFAVSGIYSNEHKTFGDLPVFHPEKDIKALADLVEEKVFEVLPMPDDICCTACGLNCYKMVEAILKGKKTRNDCVTDRKKEVILKINGDEIKLVPFVQKMLKDVTLATVRNFKGCEKGSIEIFIDD